MQKNPKDMATLQDAFRSLGVVPVVAMEDADNAVPLGEALINGGLPCAEITFRTQEAEKAIRNLSRAYPEMLIGAGTLLQLDQVKAAIDAGAQFAVAPGFDEAIVDCCLQQDVPVIPGVVTPTEINMALAKGLHVLKFFPAEALGGVRTLKALSAVYGEVRFIPTGGINASNLESYLQQPFIQACGGSWLVKRDLIASRQFGEIERLTQEAVAIVRRLRGDLVS